MRGEPAAALRRSMLPALPEHLPGLEVAARCPLPACPAGLDIGGDRYDVLLGGTRRSRGDCGCLRHLDARHTFPDPKDQL